jgi:23S rRNA (adenine2503-C2)-methyltransferase
MGMGEPLLNYDNVVTAIRRIADPALGAVGWRQVTVSTVGIIPGIERLMKDNFGVQLAVSLHAPDDDTRAAIVPTARKYKVQDIVDAAHDYQQHTRRVANIEYTMLAGVNDSPTHARHLATLLEDKRMHVNLIPYNPIGPGLSGRTYECPSDEVMSRFAQALRDRNIATHVRQTRGQDIDGACGQLRRRATRATTLVVLP